jgi:hypothetical protein
MLSAVPKTLKEAGLAIFGRAVGHLRNATWRGVRESAMVQHVPGSTEGTPPSHLLY